MDKTRLVVLIVTVLTVSLIVRVGTDTSTKEVFRNDAATGETVMGITRQEYLDTVSNNGQDKETFCIYEYLIDTYGLRETYKMDLAASRNEGDVHPAVYDAIDWCM